jgi:hypothetical protein
VAHRNTSDRLKLGAHHVYNRARDGVQLFGDDEDRAYFAWLIDRHLSPGVRRDRRGRPFVCLVEMVTMNARCILTSHYHLILCQKIPGGIEQLMGRVLSTYTRYHHRKYGSSGPLFNGPYRSRHLATPKQFKWALAYVHDNHKRLGVDYRFSTHRAFVEPELAPGSLDFEPALRVFGGREDYLRYIEQRALRDELDAELRREDPFF